jgi:hypothetical protein
MQSQGGMTSRIAGAVVLTVVLASAAAAQSPAPPLPPPRPDRPAAAPPEPPRTTKPSTEGAAEQKAEEAVIDTACLERIARLGLRFESRPAVRENACHVDTPVLVSALPNGVEVAPASLMTCPLAESLARWLGEVVGPEAERQFQSAPKKVLIGTSYQCRDQRNGEKLSEHAFGNGLDVVGFGFDKRAPLTIGSQTAGGSEEAFQSAVRQAACPIFATVLGPGSDADHGDHLHLDMRQRKANYRICQ